MKDKKQAILRMSLGAVGILALIAAGMTLWKLYQSGNLFDPSRMTLNDQFQENPILFSDQDPLDTQAGGENENDLLKQDPAAEDRQKPKQNPGIEDRLQETGTDDAHQLVIGGEGQGAQIIIDPDSGNVIVRPDGDHPNGTEPSKNQTSIRLWIRIRFLNCRRTSSNSGAPCRFLRRGCRQEVIRNWKSASMKAISV